MYGPRTRRGVAWLRWRLLSADLREALETIRSSGVVDRRWYVWRYPDSVGGEAGAVDHYIRFGIWEERDPSPLFSCRDYLERARSPRGIPAMLHFTLTNDADGCDPNWLFDTTWYRARHMAGEREQRHALFHYLQHQHQQALWPHPLFDSRWFGDRYRHEIPTGMSPLAFYLDGHVARAHAPNPLFDPTWYREYHGIESKFPLQHYIEYGASAGLAPHPGLSESRLAWLMRVA